MKNQCQDLSEKYELLIAGRDEFRRKRAEGKPAMADALKLKEKLPFLMKDVIDSGYQYETRKEIARNEHYTYVGAFHEGIAVASVQNTDKYFYIDKTGEQIEREYGLLAGDRTSRFIDGIGIGVDARSGNKYFINPAGEILYGLNEGLEVARDFCQGWAAVKNRNDGWYFINRDLKTKIEPKKIFPQFSIVAVDDFENGVARIIINKNVRHLSLYINESGFQIHLPGLNEIEGIHITRKVRDELTIIDIPNMPAVIYNRKTGQKMELNIYRISDFSEGLAVGTVTRTRRDPTGWANYELGYYIKPDGTNAFGAEAYFASAEPFSDGLAAVLKNRGGKYYYIDKQGKKAFDKEFTVAQPFKDGLAWVMDETGMAYCIDKQGNPAFDDQNFKVKYVFDGYFIDGVIEVQVGEDKVFGRFLIDRRGRRIF